MLGIPVCSLDLPQAVDLVDCWIAEGTPRFITACDVHGIMQAQRNPQHRLNLMRADLVTPDGMPLVWTARLRGNVEMQRIAGPDLVAAVCARSETRGWKHYFYGGAPGVARKMTIELCKKYPRLQIAGIESPPFRPLTATENAATLARIAASGADIVWVGLGCPKQEQWVAENMEAMDKAVAIAVGAAFDFHSGRISRAPSWMQRSGLEWLHRLLLEPSRLWRRYLVMAPRFIFLSLRETLSYWFSRNNLAPRRDGV
jgi:N-acetylglucosaminyldiphosphoundecaprenol N-acetyl-beta-D-mannosaminyltransferase